MKAFDQARAGAHGRVDDPRIEVDTRNHTPEPITAAARQRPLDGKTPVEVERSAPDRVAVRKGLTAADAERFELGEGDGTDEVSAHLVAGEYGAVEQDDVETPARKVCGHSCPARACAGDYDV